MSKTIVIVGGGFCGTVVAAKLLRTPAPGATDIVLIERGPAIGRGVAYAVRDFPYLLNVPASRLAADSNDPTQFLRFAQQNIPDAGGEDFLPRALYGDYLQDLLLRAERGAPASTRLSRTYGEVRQITRRGDRRLEAQFADRPPIAADIVILALGNPPTPLQPWAAGVRDHPAYVHDPWTLPRTLGAEHSVLIVGNGLTMADIAAAATRDLDRTPALHTISRHGLLPLKQTAFRAAAVHGDRDAFLQCSGSLRRLVSMTRDLARRVENEEGDWREVVTFIRHLAPLLWRRMPEPERRRFLRHLQAHWDTHRHRVPPQLGAHLGSLQENGTLQVNAGRIESVTADGGRLRATWRPRGRSSSASLTVDFLVNAIGPNYALKDSADPLLSSLRGRGLVSEDPLNLGLRTGAHGACLDAQGRASDDLYYLGPMLRADHWEATAATELRNHAEQLAAHLTERVTQQEERQQR